MIRVALKRVSGEKTWLKDTSNCRYDMMTYEWDVAENAVNIAAGGLVFVYAPQIVQSVGWARGARRER